MAYGSDKGRIVADGEDTDRAHSTPAMDAMSLSTRDVMFVQRMGWRRRLERVA